MYPPTSEVHVGGLDNLTDYRKDSGAPVKFCSTCGDLFAIWGEKNPRDADGEPVENLGDDGSVHCVQTRLLKGVNWDELKVVRYLARDMGEPFEVR